MEKNDELAKLVCDLKAEIKGLSGKNVSVLGNSSNQFFFGQRMGAKCTHMPLDSSTILC